MRKIIWCDSCERQIDEPSEAIFEGHGYYCDEVCQRLDVGSRQEWRQYAEDDHGDYVAGLVVLMLMGAIGIVCLAVGASCGQLGVGAALACWWFAALFGAGAWQTAGVERWAHVVIASALALWGLVLVGAL